MQRRPASWVAAALAVAFIWLVAGQQAGAQAEPCYTVPGGVRTFNGTGDYSTYPWNPSMTKPSSTGRISVSAWVCPNQTDTLQTVFRREGAYQLQVNAEGDPRIHFAVWTGSGIHGLVSDSCLDTLRWQHIAGTYDGTNWRIYHNGRLVGSKAGSAGSPASNSAQMSVGGPQSFYGGNLADVKVFDVALTPQQVAAMAANPPATLPAPAGSVTAAQTVNGAAITLEIGNGLRLNQLGGTISSGGGRLFVVNVNGAPVSSDRVTVKQAEITAPDGGWRIPFDLPEGQGSGVLEFLPGGAPGFVQAKLSLTNNGPASEWQVAFPHLEGMSLGGLAPADVEFFFPYQDGWLSRGPHDIKGDYGHVASLPILAAWNTSGPGIAIQSRDTTFPYRILRSRNAAADSPPPGYYPNLDGVETRFGITKPGATLAGYSLPFTLGTNATWNAPATVLQIFAGTNRFKEVLASYGQWARANWWTHRPVPADLRDRFISVPHWSNNNGDWWGGRAESLQDNYRAHPAFEWAYWWDQDESIQVNGKPYMLTHGNYGFESNWGGAPAYAADVARCRSAGAATCLYLQARIVWKQSQVGLAHKTDWGWMDMPGRYNEDWTGTDFGYGHIGDMWSMCPQATGWHQYLAEACRAAVQGTGADGVRLDTATQYLVCHNPNHSHTETMDGVCAFFQTVRAGLDAVGPGKWLKVEHIGSDAAARYFDASLGQAYDAGSPNASLVSDAYGLVPFRFVFPEVKLFEWGDTYSDAKYHRASRRMLFNGVGTTLGCAQWHYPELFHFTEVLRGMGDVLASTDCEPLVPTLSAGVLANRFSLNGREVYTLWNRSGADVSGPLLRIPGASGRRFMEMVAGRSLATTHDGDGDVVTLAIPNDEVVMIGVFPQQVIQSIPGNQSQTFHLQNTGQLSLQVVDAATHKVLAADASALTVDDAALAGGKLILRAVRDGYLVHDCLVASPGIRNEYTPDAGTLVLWHLNEQSGSTALDAATPTIDGANNGGIAEGSTRTPGRFGGGLTASGGGMGHLSAPISPNLFADQQFSMDAWIRPTAIANDSAGASYVMGWTGPDTAQSFIRIYQGGRSAAFGVRVKLSTTYRWAEVYVPDLGVSLLDGDWHHIAGTYDNGTLKLLVDGVEMGSATPYPDYSLIPPDTFLAAGGVPWEPASGRYIGGIDEVRLSNIARADFAAPSPPPPPAAEFPPDAATVLLWHLNEGSGANTFDVASPVLDGANNGAITPGATWTAGRFGGGLDAPASGTGYVSASLGADRFTTQATMDAWIRPTAISPGGSYVMGWRGPGTEFSFVRLYQGGYSAGVGFRVTDGNSAYWAQADFNLPVNLLDGTWRHLAGTFHDGVVRIYLNGALMGAHDTGYGAGWTLMQPDTFIAAGGPPWDPAGGGGQRYIGAIDEIRLSNVARTGFTADPPPPPPTGPFAPDTRTVLLWHMSEGAGTSLADAAATALDGASSGIVMPNATWTTGRFGPGLNTAADSTGSISATLAPGLFAAQQVTMDAWIRPTAISPGGSYVMGWRGPSTGQSFVRLYEGGNAVGVGFRVFSNNTFHWAQADFNLPVNLLDGAWRHIAATYRNGVVSLYLNGALIASFNTGYGDAGWMLVPPDTFIAAGGVPWDPAAGQYFGDIDEVRLSNIARTDFAAEFVPPAISIQRTGANIVLTYVGVLQSAPDVAGPYTDVPGATSPHTINATGQRMFFRSRAP